MNKKEVNEFCKNKFVIAVKQAIHMVERCDIHVFNDDNFQKYSYHFNNAIQALCKK